MSVVGRLGRTVLTGYFGVLVVFLYAPLAMLWLFAFNASQVPSLPLVGFTTEWYREAWANTALTSALARSVQVGLLNGLVATGIGLMAAIGLASRRMVGRSLVISTLLLPLVVPYIVLAIGILILLHQIGLQTSLTAVLAGHVVISVPFALLIIYPRLQSLDDALIEAAQDLGASALSAFARITVPLIMPALAASVLITFTISFDEFAIASFVAPADAPTYPIYLYTGARTPSLIPQVIAVGTIVIALSMVLIAGAEGGRRWAERRLDT